MNQNMGIISENSEDTDMDSNAYSMFVFGIRTSITIDYDCVMLST
ncbi:MAG: hypothetical protein ACPKQO_01950 [Nitrososphaeraceae archaeon]